jgi:hypothetical protein
MPSEPAGAPVTLPRLPAGLWRHTATLLAACLATAIPALALAPLLPGNGAWIAAAVAAAAYPVARGGITWQPHRAQRWAVLAALLLGLFLGLMARALAPYLPGITLPALATEIITFGVLWGLYHAHAPARLSPPARIAASVLAAPLLVYLLALLLSRYLGLDYLQLALAGTGLAGLLLDVAVCTFVAVQVTRQAQLLAALAPPLADADAWRAASSLLACLTGYCGDGAARATARG